MEVTALRSDTKAGSEILNYYGPLPSSELLRRYGYVTPEHSRYDVAEIPWSLVRATLSKNFSITEETLNQAVSPYFAKFCDILDNVTVGGKLRRRRTGRIFYRRA